LRAAAEGDQTRFIADTQPFEIVTGKPPTESTSPANALRSIRQ
jgi:hypothetical protein